MAPGLTLNDMLAPQNSHRATRLPASHSGAAGQGGAHAGLCHPGFCETSCGVPASSRKFPKREKVPTGIGLALQPWLAGVQTLSRLGVSKTLAIGSRVRGYTLLVKHGIPSGLRLTGHETGVKPCLTSPCLSPSPWHQALPAPPGASTAALLLRAWGMMPLLQLFFCGLILSPQSLGNEQWSRVGQRQKGSSLSGPSSVSAPASPWEQGNVSLVTAWLQQATQLIITPWGWSPARVLACTSQLLVAN